MTELIKNLQIEGFRAFSKLQAEGFGKVNLITGKNNSGKSSLLEAVRILVTGGALNTFYNIFDYREEFRRRDDSEKDYGPEDIAPFCYLFNGIPNVANVASSQEGFSISTESTSLPSSSININIIWVTPKVDPEQSTITYEPVTADSLDEVEVMPALAINLADRKRIVSLDRFAKRRISFMRIESADTTRVPCIYLDPFSSRNTSELVLWWDAIALTDVEKEVVEALKIISEDIQDIAMIGNTDRIRQPPIAFAKSSRFPNRVPLKTFGDGVNRLFGIILSLCNARNGVLLIDEIENGLHYSVQPDVWRTIFQLAKKLNVQVFATTHSWDCIKGFQQAASESPEDGVLVRLTRLGENIIPTLLSEKELKIATRDQIEVR